MSIPYEHKLEIERQINDWHIPLSKKDGLTWELVENLMSQNRHKLL